MSMFVFICKCFTRKERLSIPLIFLPHNIVIYKPFRFFFILCLKGFMFHLTFVYLELLVQLMTVLKVPDIQRSDDSPSTAVDLFYPQAAGTC